MEAKISNFKTLKEARLRLLQMHFNANVGHIGGNLSCLDVLVLLFRDLCDLAKDKIILSKGHGAGALYAALWAAGVLKDEQLSTFHKDGTRLAGHPPPKWIPEIPFATGSLGHGLSLAAGIALAKKLKKEPGRTYCVTSDGEWQEGAVWEALIFAHHRQLNELVIIIDLNGLQGFGTTDSVASMGDLLEKIRAFTPNVTRVDAGDPQNIENALRNLNPKSHLTPSVIVLETIKGHGVSFMENKMDWHYRAMTKEQYDQACLELEGK